MFLKRKSSERLELKYPSLQPDTNKTYRFQQLDLDVRFTYSDVKTINVEKVKTVNNTKLKRIVTRFLKINFIMILINFYPLLLKG